MMQVRCYSGGTSSTIHTKISSLDHHTKTAAGGNFFDILRAKNDILVAIFIKTNYHIEKFRLYVYYVYKTNCSVALTRS
jgi:hypothetical protein